MIPETEEDTAMSEPITVPVYAMHTEYIRQAEHIFPEHLMPERMKKAARFRFERDRLLCIGAGMLMLRALGIPDESVLNYGPYGKPYAPGYPEFSLSHSGDWVIIAIAPDTVGADLEKPDSAHLSIADSVFTPAELDWMKADPVSRFFRLWTLKESVMKATGLGMDLEPASFDVIPFTRSEPVLLDGRSWYAASGRLEDYTFSVCAACPVTPSLHIIGSQ